MDFLTEIFLAMEVLATIGYGYVVSRMLSFFDSKRNRLIGSVVVVAVSWIIILLDALFRLFGGFMQFFSYLVLLAGIGGWWLIVKDFLGFLVNVSRERPLREEKPTIAFLLSLIGGILVLLSGLALGAFGTLIAIFMFGAGFVLWIFPILGIVIIIGAIMINFIPSSAEAWGLVILIVGIISLIGIVTALGGLLSIIGGILAIVWKPSTRVTPPPPPRP
jgi:hypothetical protein